MRKEIENNHEVILDNLGNIYGKKEQTLIQD